VIEGDAGPGVPRILLDNREAQRTAAEHLRALGHSTSRSSPCGERRLRGGPLADIEITIDVTRDRLAGARDVFPDAPVIATAAAPSTKGSPRGVRCSPTRPPPTAVIAQSDLLAAGSSAPPKRRGCACPTTSASRGSTASPSTDSPPTS
jgi:DNA-binding LacI/PurR family transcriptional regulator